MKKPETQSGGSINRLVRHFRILRGWVVEAVNDPKYSGEVSINPKLPRACVYMQEDGPPHDFELHEVLHCALHALARVPGRKQKEAREALVRDICSLFYCPACDGTGMPRLGYGEYDFFRHCDQCKGSGTILTHAAGERPGGKPQT